jgi:ketosteroid isomerase-like protein
MNPQQFLDIMAETANKHDFAAHMNLISKEVNVLGFPGFDVITYDDWYNQSKKEFEDRVLKRVTYQGLIIIAEEEDRAMFQSVETVESTDGQTNICVIEFTIQKEDDGRWRVVKEQIMHESIPDSDKS